MNAPRSQRVAVDGWLVLDKPRGMTSTHAVARLKRILNAKKAGHAGTLDPLASGILPVAFGEATKTVPFVQDGVKAYRFTVQWGIETDTDDSDGKPVQTSALRPSIEAVTDLLPAFTGTILQTPPAFSAIKIAGERAYDLARDGETVVLQPRPVTIHALSIVETSTDETIFATECGKGTYVRAIARDLGRLLGCFGHITALRRTRVGPFREADATTIEDFETKGSGLRGLEAGLQGIPRIDVDRAGAARLRRGQPVLVRGNDRLPVGAAYAVCAGVVIATGEVEAGELHPRRVFADL